jgi:hypothetical protein
MAAVRRVNLQFAPIAALVAVILCLTACEFRPALISASAHQEEQDILVQVELRSADVQTIRQRELYARLTVLNCDGSGDAFPMDPPIEGGRIPGASTTSQVGTVQITGRVPVWIYAKYSTPCVFLRGGGYFTGTIKSEMAPVPLKRGAGPNNSSKPTPLRGAA